MPDRPARPDWRTRLDQRITRCPDCDDYAWDQRCRTCDAPGDNEPDGYLGVNDDGDGELG
jgi:hypothetical protein